jgi:hypothetical protein
MHTLHWIAVEADSIKEAEQEVLNTLLENTDAWYDWFDNDIGGRWADNAKTLQGAEMSAGLERAKKARTEEVKSGLERIDIGAFESYINSYEGEDVEGWGDDLYNFWRIKKIAEVMAGDWNCDSYFFDLTYGTARMNDVYARLKSDPDKQFLVPIDFHF